MSQTKGWGAPTPTAAPTAPLIHNRYTVTEVSNGFIVQQSPINSYDPGNQCHLAGETAVFITASDVGAFLKKMQQPQRDLLSGKKR